jgi:enoyl-CoA hydratase/carnithine racemase
MIEPLPDLPEGVIGFEAVGEIHAADYTDVLRPALDRAAADGAIRLVYVLGDRFEGYSAGASWQDSKLAFEHHAAWRRMALVSDLEWVRHLASVFGWMVPGDFELFALAERATAITWVTLDGDRD